MKNIKKVLSICFVMIIALAVAITSFAIFGKKDGAKTPQPSEEQVNWQDFGIYYASAEEETGASAAPEHMKGGAVYIGPGVELNVNNGTYQYHESYYGGAFYIENGGTLNINGGTLRCNGAMYGGAIYVAEGGTLNLNGGKIEYNNAQLGPAVYIEANSTVNFGDNIENPGAFLERNEYADYGEFYINYYVDGVLVDYSEQKIAAFRNDETPLTYEECNGWFLNEEMTDPIEEGDVLQYTDPAMQVQGVGEYVGYHKVVDLYSSNATVDKITFTPYENIYYIASKANDNISGRLTIPKEYNGMKVLQIADNGFENTKIDDVCLSSEITSIPKYAFNGSNFKKINLTKAIVLIDEKAFANCLNLTKIIIPLNVISIGNGAFYDCTNLKTVTISESVITLGERVFNNCISLTEITIPKNVRYIGNWLFENCTGLTKIVYNAAKVQDFSTYVNAIFLNAGSSSGCSVVIGEDVTRIPACLFYVTPYQLAPNFTSVTIPDNVQSIGDFAFYNCNQVINVNMGNGVTSIGRYAFCACTSLLEITIPKSVKQIGNDAFSSCTSLGNINYYPENITSEFTRVFDGASESLSVVFGNTVNTIPKNIFNSNKGLKTVTMSNSISSVGASAFAYCSNLTTVNIPDNGVTYIGARAFYECTSLLEITIPESVTGLDVGAFAYCSGLKKINYKAINLGDFNDKNTNFLSVGSSEGCELLIGDKVTKIPEYLFCVTDDTKKINISKIVFGSNVSEIGQYAFNGITELKTINLQDTKTKKINAHAFSNTSIDSILIPTTLEEIGWAAFYNCDKLTEIDWGAYSVEFTSHNIFEHCDSLVSVVLPNMSNLYRSTFARCYNLESVVISKNIERIHQYAFDYCTSLSSVTFANDSNLNAIDNLAFGNCPLLTSITLPNKLEKIRTGAFDGANITEVVIPASCRRVGRFAFGDSLEKITFEDTTGWYLVCETSDGIGYVYCNAVAVTDNTTNINNYYTIHETEPTGDEYPNYYYFEKDVT